MRPTPVEDRIRPKLERMLRQVHFWNYIDSCGWVYWTIHIQQPDGLYVWAAGETIDGVIEEAEGVLSAYSR